LQPVVIIVVAVLFLGETVERRHVAFATVAVAATLLVAVSASGSGTWSLAGEIIAVVSLFLNAGWYLYGRIVRDRHAIDPFAFMLGVLAAAAVLLTPVAWVSADGLAMSGGAVFWSVATMVGGTAAHVLLVWAHRYVPASVSAPLLLAEPPLVAIGAWIVFGEALSPLEITGAGVVLLALWGMVRSPAVVHVEDTSVDPAPAA
jgi:drug/metabolite transporter (DMT)-like permease